MRARPLMPSAIITLDAVANFQLGGRSKAAVALATAAAMDLVTEGRKERVASIMEASYRSVNPSAAPQIVLLSPEQAIAELLDKILRAAPFSRFWPHQHWIGANPFVNVCVCLRRFLKRTHLASKLETSKRIALSFAERRAGKEGKSRSVGKIARTEDIWKDAPDLGGHAGQVLFESPNESSTIGSLGDQGVRGGEGFETGGKNSGGLSDSS